MDKTTREISQALQEMHGPLSGSPGPQEKNVKQACSDKGAEGIEGGTRAKRDDANKSFSPKSVQKGRSQKNPGSSEVKDMSEEEKEWWDYLDSLSEEEFDELLDELAEEEGGCPCGDPACECGPDCECEPSVKESIMQKWIDFNEDGSDLSGNSDYDAGGAAQRKKHLDKATANISKRDRERAAIKKKLREDNFDLDEIVSFLKGRKKDKLKMYKDDDYRRVDPKTGKWVGHDGGSGGWATKQERVRKINKQRNEKGKKTHNEVYGAYSNLKIKRDGKIYEKPRKKETGLSDREKRSTEKYLNKLSNKSKKAKKSSDQWEKRAKKNPTAINKAISNYKKRRADKKNLKDMIARMG